MLNHEQKEVISQSREDFPYHGFASTLRCIFKQSYWANLSTPALSGVLKRFLVECSCFFRRNQRLKFSN